MYKPIVEVKDETVTELLDFLWSEGPTVKFGKGGRSILIFRGANRKLRVVSFYAGNKLCHVTLNHTKPSSPHPKGKAKNSAVFLRLTKKFAPHWKEVLYEALKGMVSDLQRFEDHVYELVDSGSMSGTYAFQLFAKPCEKVISYSKISAKIGKIGYKDQDGISYNRSFGYQTLFAHYKEAQSNNIPQV